MSDYTLRLLLKILLAIAAWVLLCWWFAPTVARWTAL